MWDDLPSELRERIEKRELALRSTAFTVLVWGSGTSDATAYQKRLKIRSALEASVGVGNVLFSEDGAFQNLVERYGKETAEAIQAASFDAVVVLDTSIGPHTEISIFKDQLSENGIVFTRDSNASSQGFAATPFAAVRTVPYSAAEFDTCHEIRRRAIEFVTALRVRKARRLGIVDF